MDEKTFDVMLATIPRAKMVSIDSFVQETDMVKPDTHISIRVQDFSEDNSFNALALQTLCYEYPAEIYRKLVSKIRDAVTEKVSVKFTTDYINGDWNEFRGSTNGMILTSPDILAALRMKAKYVFNRYPNQMDGMQWVQDCITQDGIIVYMDPMMDISYVVNPPVAHAYVIDNSPFGQWNIGNAAITKNEYGDKHLEFDIGFNIVSKVKEVEFDMSVMQLFGKTNLPLDDMKVEG